MGTLWPEVCRGVLQASLGVALQSTLLLGLGLVAGHIFRRRGPALCALVYQVSLVGTLLGALFSLSLGRHFEPLWNVSLPSSTGRPAQSASWRHGLPAEPPAEAAGLGTENRDWLAPWMIRRPRLQLRWRT